MPEENICIKISGIYQDGETTVLLAENQKEYTFASYEGDIDHLLDQEVHLTVRGGTVLELKQETEASISRSSE